ncbi:MAG: hypothetical protein Q8P67_27365, partial [archaeon]|nr:hypothetical protein [archaeon]
LKEYESVRHIGVDRLVEMEALHKLIDQIVLNRLAMVETTKVHQTTMKRSHDLFLELARDNQQLGAQLAETVAERKKLEAKLR